MRKLSLTVLALIVLVGTMFAPSNAWSFTLDNEVCFLSDFSDTAGNPLFFTSLSAVIQENVLQKHTIFNKSLNGNAQIPSVLIVREVSGVTSGPSISCFSCNTVNPKQDIIDNGIVQKRVVTYLC